jgi:hypothetical protein
MWRNDLWRRSHQRHLEPRQHPRQKLFCCSIKVRKNCFQVMLGETNDAICCRL